MSLLNNIQISVSCLYKNVYGISAESLRIIKKNLLFTFYDSKFSSQSTNVLALRNSVILQHGLFYL